VVMAEVYTVKVEEARLESDGKPSAGPVYRCIYARDGLMEVPSHFESPWDFFRSLSLSFSTFRLYEQKGFQKLQNLCIKFVF